MVLNKYTLTGTKDVTGAVPFFTKTYLKGTNIHLLGVIMVQRSTFRKDTCMVTAFVSFFLVY